MNFKFFSFDNFLFILKKLWFVKKMIFFLNF
jgi:hypothetical protein